MPQQPEHTWRGLGSSEVPHHRPLKEAQLEEVKKQAQIVSPPKEQEMGRGEPLLNSERLMEKTVVRDRADSLGRKGANKRLASSPPSPNQEGRKEK